MIDENSLKTLENEIGSEDFEEVVHLFIAEMDEAMSQIDQSQQAGTLSDTFHFLKGASLNLGLTDFSALCVSGEVATKEGRNEEIDLAIFASTYQASRSHLEGYLAR